MFCPECGSRHQSRDLFCRTCGTQLTPATASQAVDTPTPIPPSPDETPPDRARPRGPASEQEVAAFAALYEQHALEIHDFLLRTLPRKGRPRSRFGLRRLLAPARRTPA